MCKNIAPSFTLNIFIFVSFISFVIWIAGVAITVLAFLAVAKYTYFLILLPRLKMSKNAEELRLKKLKEQGNNYLLTLKGGNIKSQMIISCHEFDGSNKEHCNRFVEGVDHYAHTHNIHKPLLHGNDVYVGNYLGLHEKKRKKQMYDEEENHV